MRSQSGPMIWASSRLSSSSASWCEHLLDQVAILVVRGPQPAEMVQARVVKAHLLPGHAEQLGQPGAEAARRVADPDHPVAE